MFGWRELMHLPRKPATVCWVAKHGVVWQQVEESMLNTRTQTTSRNLLLQTYICAAELATWGVGPDAIM